MSNRRRVPGKSTPAAALMPYRDAVRLVADSLADRTEFVVSVPPHMLRTVAAEAAGLPGRWLLDSARGPVLQVSAPTVLIVAALIGELAAAVVLIPKTTPAARIRAVFGDTVPDDGSRDLLIIGGEEDTTAFCPGLLADAIGRVDPVAAAQLAARDIRNLS